jgi:hypothetical protein
MMRGLGCVAEGWSARTTGLRFEVKRDQPPYAGKTLKLARRLHDESSDRWATREPVPESLATCPARCALTQTQFCAVNRPLRSNDGTLAVSAEPDVPKAAGVNRPALPERADLAPYVSSRPQRKLLDALCIAEAVLRHH